MVKFKQLNAMSKEGMFLYEITFMNKENRTIKKLIKNIKERDENPDQIIFLNIWDDRSRHRLISRIKYRKGIKKDIPKKLLKKDIVQIYGFGCPECLDIQIFL